MYGSGIRLLHKPPNAPFSVRGSCMPVPPAWIRASSCTCLRNATGCADREAGTVRVGDLTTILSGVWRRLGPRSGSAIPQTGSGRPILTTAAVRGSACALAPFFKNRSRDRQAPRTLSTAFPNSRSRSPPCPARGIRADERVYTPARDGGLRERSCSTAFPGQPAKDEPSRLCETSQRGPHNRRALQRACPRSGRRSRPNRHGPVAACSALG